MHADLCGDDKEEVVDFVMGDKAYVYSNGPCDLSAHVSGIPRPQPKRLYNFTRYIAGERPENLALDRSAKASSSQGSFKAKKAIDGNTTTSWKPAKSRKLPEWLQVDLGGQYDLVGVRLDFASDPEAIEQDGAIDRQQTSGTAYQYKVEVSRDKRQWIKVVDKTNATSTEQVQESDFVAVARYVRITVTSWPGSSPPRVGIDEFQVLGTH